MKHEEQFNKLFTFDSGSSTGIKWRKSGKPAGNLKTGLLVGNVYKDKAYIWSIKRTLFEHFTGFTPPANLYVIARDGDKFNLNQSNLVLSIRGR